VFGGARREFRSQLASQINEAVVTAVNRCWTITAEGPGRHDHDAHSSVVTAGEPRCPLRFHGDLALIASSFDNSGTLTAIKFDFWTTVNRMPKWRAS
jgi:hypothetical protein